MRRERVIAVRCPVALPVTSQVQGDSAPTFCCHSFRSGAPSVASLTTTVKKQHWPRSGVATNVPHKMNSLEPFENHSFRLHSNEVKHFHSLRFEFTKSHSLAHVSSWVCYSLPPSTYTRWPVT